MPTSWVRSLGRHKLAPRISPGEIGRGCARWLGRSRSAAGAVAAPWRLHAHELGAGVGCGAGRAGGGRADSPAISSNRVSSAMRTSRTRRTPSPVTAARSTASTVSCSRRRCYTTCCVSSCGEGGKQPRVAMKRIVILGSHRFHRPPGARHRRARHRIALRVVGLAAGSNADLLRRSSTASSRKSSRSRMRAAGAAVLRGAAGVARRAAPVSAPHAVCDVARHRGRRGGERAARLRRPAADAGGAGGGHRMSRSPTRRPWSSPASWCARTAAATRRPHRAGGQRAQRHLPVLARRVGRRGAPPGADRIGRAVSHLDPRASSITSRAPMRLRHPTWTHGRQDHASIPPP